MVIVFSRLGLFMDSSNNQKDMIIHCDGSCYYKDKHMGVGIAFFEDNAFFPFREEAITILGLGTSNEAEYHAIIQALLIILGVYDFLPIKTIRINSDSQLIINQITGEWQCRNKKLTPLLDEVWRLVREIKKPLILFNWVPRTNEKQQIVDALSKKANPYYNK